MQNDKIKVYLTNEEIQQGVKNLASKLNNLYKDKELYVVCVLKGAVIFASDLVRYLTMPVKMEFIRLSSYGSSTISSGNVNALDASLSDLNGKDVLIVEDIVDSGLTARYLIDFLNKNYKMKSLKFCSLLNKSMRREVEVNPDFYVFDVDDKFIVGYGLDYDGDYRNLPYIGYFDK